jgi:hypothetical protein
MEEVRVQILTFFTSTPNTAERQTAYPLEAVDLQLNTF